MGASTKFVEGINETYKDAKTGAKWRVITFFPRYPHTWEHAPASEHRADNHILGEFNSNTGLR
jgi:hypothetical protein